MSQNPPLQPSVSCDDLFTKYSKTTPGSSCTSGAGLSLPQVQRSVFFILHWDISITPAIPLCVGTNTTLTSEVLGHLSDVKRGSLNVCLFLRAGAVISQMSLPLHESSYMCAGMCQIWGMGLFDHDISYQ